MESEYVMSVFGMATGTDCVDDEILCRTMLRALVRTRGARETVCI